MADWIKQRKELEYQVLKLAEKDKNFRKKLVENPKAAAEEFGFKLPKEFNLKVIKEKKGERILIIPETIDEHELSDLQMVSVSGGKGGNRQRKPIDPGPIM